MNWTIFLENLIFEILTLNFLLLLNFEYLYHQLTLNLKQLNNNKKQERTFVYVGKVDEISRDLLYIVEKLVKLIQYINKIFLEIFKL